MIPSEFYSTPWIGEALVQQCFWRYLTLRFDYGLRRHYREEELRLLASKGCDLWRLTDNPFFELHSARGDANDPTSLSFFIKRGVQEFIPEVSKVFDLDRTDTIIIDLDPKGDYEWSAVTAATKVVHAALCHPSSHLRQLFPVLAWKMRFSGNRSYHIYIRVDGLFDFPLLREAVKKSLDVVCAMYPSLTYSVPQANGKILIDIGAIARHRCVRSLWSLHHKTGLVCVPVENLDTFDRKEAAPEYVLSLGRRVEVF